MDPNAQFGAAREAIRAGEFARAESLLRGLMEAVGEEPLVLSMLGVALRRLGRLAEAVEVSARAAARAPGHPGVLVNYGNLLLDAGRAGEAAEVFGRAVGVAPGVVEARVGLSRALTLQGRLLDAADVCREALAVWPEHAKLSANLAAALLYAGDSRQAIPCYEFGAARWPDELPLVMGRAAARNYAGDDDAGRVAEAHRAAGALIARQEGSHPRPAITDPSPGRRLRIGLISADFRAHASAFFLDPILRHAGHAAYHLYSTGAREDAVTERLSGLAAAFHRVGDLGPAELAARIRRDAMDILLDVSGYAEGQRLAAFQHRCAPVQGTYLAYASTTGLPAMDFRLVDAVTDPAGEAEAFSTERLERIEGCLLAYAPGGGLVGGVADVPAPAPARAAGPIVFGSFRGLQLLTERTLALWVGVLRAVPGARLLVKNHGLGGEREREALRQRLERAAAADGGAALEPDRLVLEGPAPGSAALLREYARIDIALDAFPYSGTTTVCESLSMGVPMVTLAGRTSASRVCASILRAAGMAEFIAEDDGSFVRIASGLAADVSGLARLRRELPGRFAASAACDGAGFAGRFEAALRRVWTGACAGRGGLGAAG